MIHKRTKEYAAELARLIRIETISVDNQTDLSKFYELQDLLRELFPELFAVVDAEDFDGSMLLRWKGTGDGDPLLLMNHHDVVEAPGEWRYPPFSGQLAEDKVWGRGTLDTKGGLWAMLRAANELVREGYVPTRDIYFLSTRNEERDGAGADRISLELAARGVRFFMVLDEGGMILEEPIGGAKGTFALVGVGEKGCADLKFVARSQGGHAAIPGKNTPLVRIGKFMAAVERSHIFKAEISPAVSDMLCALGKTMKPPLSWVLSHPRLFKPVLKTAMPIISNVSGAMLKTTVAFTMACGSEGINVLPQEAWVMGNMRFSHHQGGKESIEAIAKLAKKFDIETEILDPGMETPLSDHHSEAFELVRKTVDKTFDGYITAPYVMTAASDSRYMDRVSDNCLRFTPFLIDDEQMESIHGLNENVNISTLAPAVDFYKNLIIEVNDAK